MLKRVMRQRAWPALGSLSAALAMIASLAGCDALWPARAEYDLVQVNGRALPAVTDTITVEVGYHMHDMPATRDSTVQMVTRWVSGSLVLMGSGRYELTMTMDREIIGESGSRVSLIPLSFEGQYDETTAQPLIPTYEGELRVEFQEDGTILLRDRRGSFRGAVFEYVQR